MAQDVPVGSDNVPFQVSRCLKGFSGKYQVLKAMNPFYLRGDFDGDKKADYVALIEELATNKQGLLFCFGDANRKPQVLGAGVNVQIGDGEVVAYLLREEGASVDDSTRKGVLVDDLTSDPDTGVWGVATGCGQRKHDCVYLGKSEAGGGWFIWDGRRFVWRQGGI